MQHVVRIERLSNLFLAVVLKIGRIYLTLGTLSRSVIMLHRDEQATSGTSIKILKNGVPMRRIPQLSSDPVNY
jgi:hypothetical protein